MNGKERLALIGYNPDRDWAWYTANPDEPIAGRIKKPTLWTDDKENLCIGIFDLDRNFITVDVRRSKTKLDHKIFHLIRWNEPKIIDGEEAKITPFESGHGVFPYLPIEIVEKYRNKTTIKTLVITEGQIKADVASRHGLDIVGIPGIQIWNAKDTPGIFKSIERIITDCNVEHVIFLTDADTMRVQWSEGKDLGKRPNNFCNAVTQFKERMRDFNVKHTFAHIKESSVSKGIDDLILDNVTDRALIFDELLNSEKGSKWFHKIDIGSSSINKIRTYFGLNEGVTSFYDQYEEIIGLREFVFLKSLYKYDEITNKVKYEKCGESTQFIMVDSTYFIKGPIRTKYGEVENALKPIKPAGIKGMFKTHSKNFSDDAALAIFLKKLFYDIPYYNGFINMPAHINWKKEDVVSDKDGHQMRYYNKYFQLSHNVAAGECPLSIDFVKHIFGTGQVTYKGKTYNEWDLGLDYIQILYLYPTEILPILVLASKERGTGKTKFCEWMGSIFQQNVKPVSSQQLTGQFTSLFASALLIYIDEAFIDKKETMERLKSLVTSDKTKIEYKGVDADVIDNYVKVIFSTNDENNFAQISEDELRFWIRKILPIPADKKSRHWFDNLVKEIPAFLHYLKCRDLVTEWEERGWFAQSLIRTEALEAVVRESKSKIEISLQMVLREQMSKVKKAILYYSSKDLKELVDDKTINLPQVRWALEERMGLKNSVYSNPYEIYELTSILIDDKLTPVVQSKEKTSVFYTITASSVYEPEQIFELFNISEIIEMEKKEIKLFGKSRIWQKFNNRNKGILKNYDPFKTRTDNALEILITDCDSLAEAYTASFELNENQDNENS
jgi:hypothetical protein